MNCSTYADSLLEKGVIKKFARVKLNGTEVFPMVYNYNQSRNFGASSFGFQIEYDEISSIDVGDIIEFWEGYYYNGLFEGKISTDSGSVSSTSVVYSDQSGDLTNESDLSMATALYNETRKTVRKISSVDLETHTITTPYYSDEWAEGDTIKTFEDYYKFYGEVKQVELNNVGGITTYRVTALDKLADLQGLEIQKTYEATKVEVEDELLTPNYLSPPNDTMAQIFDFANENIATSVLPNIRIKNTQSLKEEPRYSGYDLYYDVGQLMLGIPIQAQDNFEVRSDYYFYPMGTYAEDIIEDIFKLEDGYGNIPFTDSELQDTFLNVSGSSRDEMTPNYDSREITIYKGVTVAVSAGDTSITVDDVEGLPVPQSGDNIECSLNGDVFTYNNIESGNVLSGIPATGSYALKDHPIGSIVKYTATYDAGQLWFTTYDNIITDLSSSDFELPSGVTIDHVDERFGRIILSEAISLTSDVYCITNYSFSTIQSTGVEISNLSFTYEDTPNRLEALNVVRELVAPNYTFFTRGNKIWGMYMRQKVFEDYQGRMLSNLSLAEDQDIHTRVRLFGKNNNPENISRKPEVSFVEPTITAELDGDISASDTIISYTDIVGGEFKSIGMVKINNEYISYTSKTDTQLGSVDNPCVRGAYDSTATSHTDGDTISFNMYSAVAYDVELTPVEGDLVDAEYYEDPEQYIKALGYVPSDKFSVPITKEDLKEWQIYKPGLGIYGKITIDNFVPIIYINNVPVNDTPAQISQAKVMLKEDVTITTAYGKKETKVDVSYQYVLWFSHGGISPDEPIYVYNSVGETILTIPIFNERMNYTEGYYVLPGSSKNETITTVSTASYWVRYSSNSVRIDYANALFFVNKNLLGEYREDIITADFEYVDTYTELTNGINILDGDWNTQTQTIFKAEPLSGYVWAIVNLGQEYNVDHIDLMAGSFKPDNIRSFPFTNKYTLQYSLDGTTYYNLCQESVNFSLTSHDSISFSREEFGVNFRVKYLKLVLENAEKIPYTENGTWCISFVDISIYKDSVLTAEAKLIPTAKIVSIDGNTINVDSTSGFDTPGSGESVTAYIEDSPSEDEFTYDALSATAFLGCAGVNSGHIANEYIYKELEGDTTLYDVAGLLRKIGDKIYKVDSVSEFLDTQTKLNDRAKLLITEFYKEHTKANGNCLFSPHTEIGDSIRIISSQDSIDDIYFVEEINNMDGRLSITIAKYD